MPGDREPWGTKKWYVAPLVALAVKQNKKSLMMYRLNKISVAIC